MNSLIRGASIVGVSGFLLLPLAGHTASWTAGEGSGGDYEINDTTSGSTPLTIKASTPSDALFLDDTGNLGLGSAPRRVPPPDTDFSPRFYISDPTPDIEFDDIDDPQIWQLFADGGDISEGGTDDLGGIGFFDQTASRIPFYIESEAPDASMWVKTNGNVGIGTLDPEYNMHVLGDGVGDVLADTERVLLVESSLAPEQVFRNTTSGAIWYFAMVSNDTFKISFDGTGRVEARFKPSGDLIIRGALTENSDRNSKKNIEIVDGKSVLDTLIDLPISTWEYKASSGVRHLGPMAQDFHAAFGLGESPTGISTIDTAGVALAAIKALKQEKDDQIEQLAAQNSALADSNAALQHQLQTQETRMLQLEMALLELRRGTTAEVQVSSSN